MNREQIANLFIRAAFVDTKLPIDARPKRLKGASLPFFHTEADVNGRRMTGISHGKEREHLLPGDDPLAEWRTAFIQGLEDRISRNDVRLWEVANDLMTLVADEGNRRALWAWAKSKVGTLEAERHVVRQSQKFGMMKVYKKTDKDVSFAAWCRSEGIHEMTGSRRKNRAIDVLEQYLVRGASSNDETGYFGVLPVGPVFEHISDNIAADAPSKRDKNFERDADTVFAKESKVFDWREYRNERRRLMSAKRREISAA